MSNENVRRRQQFIDALLARVDDLRVRRSCLDLADVAVRQDSKERSASMARPLRWRLVGKKGQAPMIRTEAISDVSQRH